MTAPKVRHCKDCPDRAPYRPCPNPGPRCATHWREEKQRRSRAAHGNRTENTYGITEEEYWEIYKRQGGKCFICQRATGATKRLAVDHNHETGAVRAILCGPCNKDVLGRLGADALIRAIEVLVKEPAQAMLKEIRDNNHDQS